MNIKNLLKINTNPEKNSSMKIKTFPTWNEAKVFGSSILTPIQILMPCDINANSDGYAWAIGDSQFRYMRECGVLC